MNSEEEEEAVKTNYSRLYEFSLDIVFFFNLTLQPILATLKMILHSAHTEWVCVL